MYKNSDSKWWAKPLRCHVNITSINSVAVIRISLDITHVPDVATPKGMETVNVMYLAAESESGRF